MSSLSLARNNPLFHVIHPDGDSMLDPKWFVGGFTLGALALIFSYDLRIGLAITAALAVIAMLYLALRVWLATGSDAAKSEREVMFNRFTRLSRNRQSARSKELDSKRGPDAS